MSQRRGSREGGTPCKLGRARAGTGMQERVQKLAERGPEVLFNRASYCRQSDCCIQEAGRSWRCRRLPPWPSVRLFQRSSIHRDETPKPYTLHNPSHTPSSMFFGMELGNIATRNRQRNRGQTPASMKALVPDLASILTGEKAVGLLPLRSIQLCNKQASACKQRTSSYESIERQSCRGC